MDPKFTFSAHADADGSPKKVNFFTLSRAIQERFVASTRRGAQPVPILFQPARSARALVWLSLGLCFAALALAATRLGLGDAASSLAFHKREMMGVYGAFAFGSVYSLIRAVAVRHAAKTLPFTPGVYVYASCVIDASTHVLRVHSMRDLAKCERRLQVFQLAFTSGARLSFTIRDEGDADRVERALARAREELLRALDDDGPRSMAQIDPLFGGVMGSPLGPSEPYARAVPFWARFGWAFALLVAAGVAPMAWNARNIASDDRMYATAKRSDTVIGYKAYLGAARPGAHKDEVAQTLLPRAELREAEKGATVDVLVGYARSHRGSRIQGEIDASLRKAMLGELEKAKAAGTVTALRDFAKKYPDHKIEPELRAATHALYVAALERYKAQAPSAEAIAVFERALAYAEKNGPAAEVRFRLKASKTLDKADESAKKSKYFQGEPSLPSRYFAADKLRDHQEALTKTLVDKLSATFPADVLAFKAGAPVPESDALPAFTAPTFVVDYSVEWSRTQTVTVRPRGVFVGINMPFEVSFAVPDGAKPMALKVVAWRGPELWQLMDAPAEPRGARETKVYATVADAAFGLVEKRALDAWFRPEPGAKAKK